MFFIAATPVETFMAVANATAALVGKAPPYVSYRVSGTLHVLKGDASIDRRVVVRTIDGDAVISDEKGRTELKPPFPRRRTSTRSPSSRSAGTSARSRSARARR